MGDPRNGQKHEEAGIQWAQGHGPLRVDQRIFRIATKRQRSARQKNDEPGAGVEQRIASPLSAVSSFSAR